MALFPRNQNKYYVFQQEKWSFQTLRTIPENQNHLKRLFSRVVKEQIDLEEAWRDKINRLVQLKIIVTHYGEIQTANIFLKDLEPDLLAMEEYAGRITLPSGEVALTFHYHSDEPDEDEFLEPPPNSTNGDLK
jgi:hypothetical protein